MNRVWAGMLLVSIVFAALSGNIGELANTFSNGAEKSLSLTIGLMGTLTLWSGLNRIAQKAGIVDALGVLLRPVISRLFPSLRNNPRALAAVMMNLIANLFGLGNAATPLGLEAMRLMQERNPEGEVATDAMCTLLTLNTTGLTIFPATVVGLRIAAGSNNPNAIVVSALLASLTATVIGLVVDRVLRGVYSRG